VVGDEFRDPPDSAKPLTGAKPWQSLRIGDYRAIVRFDWEGKVMQVGAVGHRSSIYDECP
jgi:mRNA-degrading endonuclease RelE of RelBE toxin-antitoxin system